MGQRMTKARAPCQKPKGGGKTDENPKKPVLTKPIKEYAAMHDALTGLADKTKEKYIDVMTKFCEFVGKDPDQILAERKEHERSRDERVKRTYERKIVEFYEYLKTTYNGREGKPLGESSAYISVGVVRGFFSRNYCKTVFRRGDLRAPETKSLDIIPTIGEIKEIHDAADIRDKAIIIFDLQTGMAPIDIVNLRRADFERALKGDEFPKSLGWLQRHKSRMEFHPFLFRDSAVALKRYLQNRKDDSPYLFVDRSGRPFSERNVNDIFTKAAERAGIEVPEGKRLRVYCLRSVFETQMGNAGMPQTWIDLMMGHKVGGSRGKYTKPPEADWLEKARKAEQFISISRVRNMDVLREKIDQARTGDALEWFLIMEKERGVEATKEACKAYLILRPMIEYGDGDLMPSQYVMAQAAEEYLALRKRRGRRKFTTGRA